MRERNGRMRSDPAARGGLTVETEHNSQPPLIQTQPPDFLISTTNRYNTADARYIATTQIQRLPGNLGGWESYHIFLFCPISFSNNN
jgi:hypothetical protein